MLEGSKGSLVADCAAVRAVALRDKRPSSEVWGLFRRSVDGAPDEAKLNVDRSCASVETPLEELVRA